MIDNEHIATILSKQRQTFLDLLGLLQAQLAHFEDLNVYESSFKLDNQYSIEIMCSDEREIISSPILETVFDFCTKYHFSFFVDVDRAHFPRLVLYIKQSALL